MQKRSALSLSVLAAVLSLQACGAGIVAAVVSSNNNNPPPPAPSPPELSLPESRFPLVPADANSAFRTVVVSNAQLQGTTGLQIEIRALGVRAPQGSPVIVSAQGGSTVVAFLLRTDAILAVVPDPTAQDVPGQLAVLSAGAEVAPPVPVQLLRQPRASLVLPGNEQSLFLSPLGGSRVSLVVSGLRAVQPGDLQVLVTTVDASGNTADVTRQCTGIALAAGPGADNTVSADVPGNTFSGQANLFVVDSVAGLSTVDSRAYYRPELTVALPAQGPTTGGSLVTLIGRALAPLDLSVQPPRPAFDQVTLLFQKGTAPKRELVLAPQDLREQESGLDRLVFTMPASPDGRPGAVDIILRVRLGTVTAQVIATNTFTFANPQPVFGPRGAVLDRTPVASSPIRLESAPNGTDAPDFALLYSEAGVGFLQLMAAEENGMFVRFGRSRQLGDPGVASERDPRDLCVGDFDGDRVPDILAINGGTTIGTHHLTLGQPRPLPPLGPIARIVADAGAQQCVAADFDRDGVQDFVLLPGPAAGPLALPSIWLARPHAVGQPAFVFGGNLPVRTGLRERILAADLDGDGFLDVAVASAGAQPQCDIAYGHGDGSFQAGPQLDLTISGYVPDGNPLLVGLHVCGNTAPRPVVMVFGIDPQGLTTTPTTVAVLPPTGSRTYSNPVPNDVLRIDAQIAVSLSADLDQDGTPELVLAFLAENPVPFPPLLLGRWNGTTFEPIGGAVEVGSEQMFNITALHFGTAFPADPVTPRDAVNAVFVLHDSRVDGIIEHRLSTLLVNGGPSLLAPDAGGQVPFEVQSVVGGSFDTISTSNGGRTRDIALATLTSTGTSAPPGQVRLLKNDGAGGFFQLIPTPLQAPRIVPATLMRAQITPEFRGGDSLAWLDRDSKLYLATPFDPRTQQRIERVSEELRQFSPNPRLTTADVADTSRIVCTDVDGDGVQDMVVMLTFQVNQPAEGDALLFLLRGKAVLQPGEFPFHMPASPQVVTLLHGNSTSVALGDFVPSSSTGPVQLEAAVAVPRPNGDGDHVRFYRYVAGAAPAADRLARSFMPGGPTTLLAGEAPTYLAAADFDNNGTIDLLIAGQLQSGDSTLRLFLNSGDPGSNPAEVNVAAFLESLTSPQPISPGTITSLRLGDINGDRKVDALVTTQSTQGPPGSTVAFYLSDGTGSFANPVFVSPTRLGNRAGVLSIDLSDFNGDQQLDLAAVWNTSGAGDRNVRVLFGGSR